MGTTSGALAFQLVESESWHGKLHLQFPARSYKGQAQLWTLPAVLKVPFLHGENTKKGTRLLRKSRGTTGIAWGAREESRGRGKASVERLLAESTGEHSGHLSVAFPSQKSIQHRVEGTWCVGYASEQSCLLLLPVARLCPHRGRRKGNTA